MTNSVILKYNYCLFTHFQESVTEPSSINQSSKLTFDPMLITSSFSVGPKKLSQSQAINVSRNSVGNVIYILPSRLNFWQYFSRPITSLATQ